MSSSSCDFLVASRSGAGNPSSDEQSICTSGFRFPMLSLPTPQPVEPRRTSQVSNFIAESQYLHSVSQQALSGHASWKSGFSQTNRLLWTEALKLAIGNLLKSEVGCSRFIDDEGIHRYAELVEWAIFEYQARDPREYGNAMGAKYDAILGGNFTQEESKLLHHYVWAVKQHL